MLGVCRRPGTAAYRRSFLSTPLLFNQNLLFHITTAFPGSAHVRDKGLNRADDGVIWEYAKRAGFAIVSKDSDFYQRSLVYGHPPKVIGICRGNCSTRDVIEILQAFGADMAAFLSDTSAAFLVLS